MSELLTVEHFEKFEKKIDQRFDAVNKRFDAVDKRFDAVDQQFDAVDQRFDKIETNHQELMLAVADVVTKVNDHLDERLEPLEKLTTLPLRADKVEVFLAKEFGRDKLSQAGL